MSEEENNNTALVLVSTTNDGDPENGETKTGKGLRKDNRKYESLSKFIAERINFLFHSQSNLTRVSGFKSRQVINERFAAACNRHTTHDWWETVLMVPSGTLSAIGTSDSATDEALNKYNNVSYYGGRLDYHVLRAIAETLAFAITPWDTALRAEKMSRTNQERAARLIKARKEREKILGF